MKTIKSCVLTLLFFVVGSLLFLFMPKTTIYANAKSDTYVVRSKEEFINALSMQKTCIKVSGNIDFGGERISLNYSITISANNNGATITNGYFVINGSETNEFVPLISIDGLVFDGCVNAGDYELTATESFDTILGSDREDKRCINGVHGYYDLKINNCTIKNYAAVTGPCLYVENTEDAINNIYWHDHDKNIEITNSRFYNNISQWDTLHLSNDKNNVNITNCEFFNNYAYKAAGFSVANGKATIDGVKVYDNYFCEFDVSKSNPQNCGGGIYLGATDISLTNSIITNNQSVYGGGLGVSSSWSGDRQIVIENVVIKNNKATYGGGACVHSLAGQPINFINCDISNNAAKTGSALYTDVYAFWYPTTNGGLVNLFFCSILLNTAEDANAFNFYYVEGTKGSLGNIVVKGCFVIGDDTLAENNEDDYNYVANLDTAINDGVVSQNIAEVIANQSVSPLKGSKADIKVAPKVYHTWSALLEKYNKTLSIGRNDITNKKSYIVWYVVTPCVCFVVVVFIVVYIVVVRKKKSKATKTGGVATNEQVTQAQPGETGQKEKMLLSTLSEREFKIVQLIVQLKRRKEIARELCFSENTIKKDLSSIYAKLKVKDKTELIAKYKDLV